MSRSRPFGTGAGAVFPPVLFVHSVVVQMMTFLVRPSVSYRAIELGVEPALLGVIGAAFAVAPLLLAIPAGHLTDSAGERTIMLGGALVFVASALVLTLSGGTLTALLLGTALLGIGHLLSVVGQQAMVANLRGPASLDHMFGYYTFAASLGQALGPSLIVALGGESSIPDTRGIFLGSCFLAGAVLLTTLLLPRRQHDGERPAEDSPVGMLGLLRRPGVFRAILVSCVVLATVDITIVYLPAWGAERGMTAGFVGVLLSVRAGASMASRLFLGRLVGHLGRPRLMVVGLLVSAVSLGSFVLPLGPPAAVVMITLLGLALGVGQPLTMSWLAQCSPAGSRGRAMSLRLTGNRLGQVAIPSTVGAVAAGVGAAGVLGVTAVTLAAVSLAVRRSSGPAR